VQSSPNQFMQVALLLIPIHSRGNIAQAGWRRAQLCDSRQLALFLSPKSKRRALLCASLAIRIRSMSYASNSDSTNSWGLKGSRSSIFSPTPTN
jgi:hypothetical protein